MIKFSELPTEVLICIAEASSALSTLNALARTSRCLYAAVNPVLYRSTNQDEKRHAPKRAIWWATLKDAHCIVRTLVAYHSGPKYTLDEGLMAYMLHSALKYGSFKTANTLLDARAGIVSCAEVTADRRSHGKDKWMDRITGVGCLATAAGAKYHRRNGKDGRQYTSETDFCRWKKVVMLRIFHDLQIRAMRGPPEELAARLAAYQYELDSAFSAALCADSHTLDVMELLFAAGANINRELKEANAKNAVMNAVLEETPTLFMEKVRFLADKGADFSRAQSWDGMKTARQRLIEELRARGSMRSPHHIVKTNNTLAAIEYLRVLSFTTKTPPSEARVDGDDHLSSSDFETPLRSCAELRKILNETDVDFAFLRETITSYISLDIPVFATSNHEFEIPSEASHPNMKTDTLNESEWLGKPGKVLTAERGPREGDTGVELPRFPIQVRMPEDESLSWASHLVGVVFKSLASSTILYKSIFAGFLGATSGK